ncbi:YoaK family protein [Kitasatospora sp. NPDC056138]|uniref:YoaK family protein n=1 Tax=Kitasatospora sp. NPDC056138 TaxID=3345724 RepID=UPI0035DFD0FB
MGEQGIGAREHLPAVLMVLTVVSGFLDAVSFLGLGRVFTANMTGNVVVVGFAAAGAPGFSAVASLTSLAGFLAGAVLAGRFAVAMRSRPAHRWFGGALVAEAALTGLAGAVASLVQGTAGRLAVIAVLALAMGIRNASVRRVGVADLTTTVLTMTLTGLAADSLLAGGAAPRAGRRAGAAVAMAGGAFVGAWFQLHHGVVRSLALCAVGVALVAAVLLAHAELTARRCAR